MPVKIRLMRIGTTKRPFYRVVAVDERRKRTGGYLELLGSYNPIVEPKEIILKQERIDEWLKKGAVLSDGFLRIIGKAPQRPPRKPKKDKPQTAAPAAATPETEGENSPVPAEEPEESVQVPEAEEPVAEEAPIEETPTATE